MIWRSFWLIGVLALSSFAHAQDYIAQQSWLEDPSGKLNLADVQAMATTEFTGALSRGYGVSAIWLRLRIDPTVNPEAALPSGSLVLRLRPVYVDDIQVFDPLAPGGVAGRLGDAQHPRLDAMQGQDFLLPILRGSAPRDIWLRLTSTSTRQIYAQVLDQRALEEATLHENLLFSLYVGAVTVLMLWGLVGWAVSRERLMAAFTFKAFTALLFALSSMGFLRAIWPAEYEAQTLDTLGSVLSILGVIGALAFHAIFMKEFALPLTGLRLVNALVGVAVLLLGLLLLGYIRLALQLNMLLILISPVLLLLLVLFARSWPLNSSESTHTVLPRSLVVGFYTLLMLLLLLSSSTSLGWAQASVWTIYIVQVQGLVTSVLMLIMLQYRTYLIGIQRQQTLVALESARLQGEHELQLRHENEKLLTMLAHEIKTPLATMYMRLNPKASGANEMRQAMRDMNNIIERCIQTTKLEDNVLLPNIVAQDLVKIILEAVAACPKPEQITLDLPPSMLVQTDAQLMFIVIHNLLENACKYGAIDRPISLIGQVTMDTVQVTVLNNPGHSGWPEPDKVFDKYYRSPQAQRQPGTGLGLYLAKHLVNVLGGDIHYRPDKEWVRFVVNLPRAMAASA